MLSLLLVLSAPDTGVEPDDLIPNNLEFEDGSNKLLEDGSFHLLEG